MPVLSENNDDKKSKRFTKNYIRIQNLPWTACSSDIKHFFKGLSIIQGGCLVRNFEAYVAFENMSDICLALNRRNILLHGCKLELSVVNEVELRKILCKTARRQLNFETMRKRDDAKLNIEDTPKRKIRPTPVLKGNTQRSLSYATFLPIEIDPLSVSSSVGDCNFTEVFPSGKRSVSGIRRLHPTSVSNTMEMENLAVFHSEDCYQAKRMRVDK